MRGDRSLGPGPSRFRPRPSVFSGSARARSPRSAEPLRVVASGHGKQWRPRTPGAPYSSQAAPRGTPGELGDAAALVRRRGCRRLRGPTGRSSILRLQHDLYLGIYFVAVGGLLWAYATATQLDVRSLLRRTGNSGSPSVSSSASCWSATCCRSTPLRTRAVPTTGSSSSGEAASTGRSTPSFSRSCRPRRLPVARRPPANLAPATRVLRCGARADRRADGDLPPRLHAVPRSRRARAGDRQRDHFDADAPERKPDRVRRRPHGDAHLGRPARVQHRSAASAADEGSLSVAAGLMKTELTLPQ